MRFTHVGIGLLFAALLMLAVPTRAWAQWAIIGAAGVPDEGSATAVVFNDAASVSLKAGVGSAHIRYPVTSSVNKHVPCNGEAGDPEPCTTETEVLCMHVLARDTGSNARVRAVLVRVDNASGAMTSLAQFDSNSSIEFASMDPFEKPGNTDYREGAACVVTPISAPYFSGAPAFRYPANEIDLGGYSYFVDVTLTRTTAAGNPGLKAIMLRQDPY